jgi:two-component system chemotaxis response regulator CheY
MLKIVVIDNNAVSRNLLSTLLIGGGHDVVGDANTRPSSLARMISLHPQVVCIDIGHDDEGMENLATIRAELPKALLFLVSAKFSASSIESGLQQGVHGFIVKPFNAATVLASIRNAVLKLARQHKAATDA